MTDNEIIEALSNLRDEKTRQYELTLTDYAKKNNTEEFRTQLENIIATHSDPQVRYNAFYCMNIVLRYSKDYQPLHALFQTYEPKFKYHITYSHLKALFEIESDSLYDYEEILNSTYKDSMLFDNNAGFIHMFADVFASICEKGRFHDRNEFINTWSEPAWDAITRAIRLDPAYAKYYCTKARLLCLKGDFDQAEININKAIEVEDSRRQDYFLRINMYQYYKMMIYTERRLAEIQRNAFAEARKTQQSFGIEVPDTVPVIPAVQPKEPYEGNLPYAFVSYSHLDSDSVLEIICRLQDENIRIWYDKGIPPAIDYNDYIARKIKDSGTVILFVTPNSMRSEYVRREINFSSKYYKDILPIYLSEAELTPGMELTIGSNEDIRRYAMSKEDFERKLINYLKHYAE